VLIDYRQLSEEALRGIAQTYVLQHLHTDDGEYDLASWVDQVLQQIRNGQLVVEWSEIHENVTLKPKDQVIS